MLVLLLISKYISLHADLVEKAYWQIALTDSDEKLERALGRLLAPVLLKASSKDSAVREKVLNLEVKMVLTSVHKSLRWTATVLEGHFKEYHSSLTATHVSWSCGPPQVGMPQQPNSFRASHCFIHSLYNTVVFCVSSLVFYVLVTVLSSLTFVT